MLIGVDKTHRIKQVNDITDSNLTIIEINDSDVPMYFSNWSSLKITCHCYKVDKYGRVSIYPYIPVDIIEFLDRQENENAELWYTIAMGGMM